jgi:hypothetical protein
MDVVAGIAEPVAALTTVGCPLETVLTLWPANFLVFVDAAATENVCWANRVLAPWATRHWSENESVQDTGGVVWSIFKKSGFFLFFCGWVSGCLMPASC